jgi:uncharacterized protein (TIGR00251 family)
MQNMHIKVKVKRNSRKNELKEVQKDYFEIKVTAPPEKGKANEKVIELISKHFKVPKSRIEIISGAAYREKVISIIQ